MSRVDLHAAANDLLAAAGLLAADSSEAGSTVRLVLVIGGVALAFAAFWAASFLGAMLSAALQAVSALFSMVGRTVGLGLVGLAVAGFAVFGLGSGPDESPPTVDQPQPPPAAQPR
jgi:hypothetical protein